MDRYDKATKVWSLLHQIQQLVVNDKDYHPSLAQDICNCMTRVEMLQFDLEVGSR